MTATCRLVVIYVPLRSMQPPMIVDNLGGGPIRRDATSWVPSIFEAWFDDAVGGFEVAIRVVISRGVPRVDEITMRRSNLATSPALGTVQLRQVKIPQLLRAALRAAARPIEDNDVEIAGAFAVAELPGQFVVGPSLSGPGRGRPVTDDHLAEVARVYAEARSAGERIDEKIRAHFHTSSSNVGRWIRQAKARGFIQIDGDEPQPKGN